MAARLTPREDLQAGARWAPALRALGDERLARMVEHGSEPAFGAIYGRYGAMLHGYCRSLLRDEEEAGDALQNAMVKALQALRRSGRTGPLRPWLFRIAHNESVSIIRARARRPGPLDEGMVAAADDAFRHVAGREQLAALLADMEHLTEHQRGALVMRELGGLSYDEIGEALNTTPLAARQAVFAARKRLRNGPLGARRLRPALRQLIPAPAGFALWGWLGAGTVPITGKALVGTAAMVSIGFGSLELAVQDRPTAKRQVVAEAPAPRVKQRREREPVTMVPATPTPNARSTGQAPHAGSAPAAAFVRVAHREVPEISPTPEPGEIRRAPAPRTESQRDPVSHNGKGSPPTPDRPAAGAPATDAAPPQPPSHEPPRQEEDPAAQTAVSDQRDCPQPDPDRGPEPETDSASAPPASPGQ